MPQAKINSQSPYRILQGESIIAALWSNQATLLSGRWRVVYDDGTDDLFTFNEFTTGSSRAIQLMNCAPHVAEKDGIVVGGVMTYGGGQASVQRGQIYVIVFISGNPVGAGPADIRSTLACGYMPPISGGPGVCFNTFIEAGPAGGHGNLRQILTADPAANSEIAGQTCPTGAIWLPRSFSVQLVQGITQTPLPTLKNTTSAFGPGWQIPITTTAISASSTAQLTWGIGLVQSSFTAVVGDEFHTAPLPAVYLLPSDTIATVTDGIGANTNYGAATFIVEEWVMPN